MVLLSLYIYWLMFFSTENNLLIITMKTVLVLSALLCAAFAAPAENIEMAAEAAVEAPQELMAAAEPAPVSEDSQQEVAAPEARFSFCPDGWFSHGSRCFLFVNSPMTWYNAEEHCNNLGGHLASATNPREYSFLQGLARTGGQSVAWLGGFKLQSTWMWIDREGFYYTNWYSQSSSSSYVCMYLNTNVGWTSYPCTNSLRFICSKNPFGC